MKKLGFFLILSILLISCTSLDSVQKTNKSHREIDEKIRIWDLESAEKMVTELSDSEKETYINIINERKEKLGKLYELENILPNSFLRISKSTIVNIQKIYSLSHSVSSHLITFQNSHKQVYVSRMYYKVLKERRNHL